MGRTDPVMMYSEQKWKNNRQSGLVRNLAFYSHWDSHATPAVARESWNYVKL